MGGRDRKRKRRHAKPVPAPSAALVSDEEEYAKENEDCSICLEPIALDARQTLRCSHSFCAPCIKAVARKAAVENAARASRLGVMIPCPMCRAQERVRI